MGRGRRKESKTDVERGRSRREEDGGRLIWTRKLGKADRCGRRERGLQRREGEMREGDGAEWKRGVEK